MGEVGSLQVPLLESQELNSPENATVINELPYLGLKRWQWWLLLALNVIFILVGQTVSTLLGGFYYEQGGNSIWMATLVQTAAFPILYIPLFLFQTTPDSSSPTIMEPSIIILSLIYFAFGFFTALDNMMYSIGLLYLPVSTYSLLCGTQLAFGAVFTKIINRQKFTVFILCAVILLIVSAIFLAVDSKSSEPTRVSRGNYLVGCLLTLLASALYSLLLSLMELCFVKLLKKHTFSVVLDMQIYPSIVATFGSIVVLFASGEWSGLSEEMNGYKKGKVSYVMTLVWTAIAWQIFSVGTIGLTFVASSLFSNGICTFVLPVVPIVAVIIFHDKMSLMKVLAMVFAVLGFSSYLYQTYLDDSKFNSTTADAGGVPDTSITTDSFEGPDAVEVRHLYN